MEKSYKMLKQASEALLVERKSRFIGYAAPVYSEEEALQFLNGIRKKHYDATHNCYAYVIGESSSVQRSSDDGEPSGTAGVPILEVIKKEALTNTAVVVTRYFGGVLLGASGLIRAYTEASARAVHEAGIILVKPFAVFNINIDYPYLSKLQYELPKNEYLTADIQYTDIVMVKVLIPEGHADIFPGLAAEWTNGTARVDFEGIRMLKIDQATNKVL